MVSADAKQWLIEVRFNLWEKRHFGLHFPDQSIRLGPLMAKPEHRAALIMVHGMPVGDFLYGALTAQTDIVVI
jgi:hypothetical protein